MLPYFIPIVFPEEIPGRIKSRIRYVEAAGNEWEQFGHLSAWVNKGRAGLSPENLL